MAAALILLFALTAGGVIWLARDVNQRVSNRSAAQSIAFQAARSGAQQVDVEDLREGGPVDFEIDAPLATEQALRVAGRLFDEYEVDGKVVRIDIVDRTVTVEVQISDTAGDVTGVGSAQAQVGS